MSGRNLSPLCLGFLQFLIVRLIYQIDVLCFAEPKRQSKKDQLLQADLLAKAELANEDRETKRVFDEITEAAMALMDAGELDIYSMPLQVIHWEINAS